MKKIIIRIHRPIEGTIVFTLMGAEGKTFTASEIFRCNHAFVPLIPNSLYPGSYYEYKVYTQWHRCWCGITSEPIEKGYCVVPDHDASLEDIIKTENIESVYATKKELEDAVNDIYTNCCSSAGQEEQTTNLTAGTGIVIENGVIRLAQKKATTTPQQINIPSQYNTPYTYYDDGEGTDTIDNPSPYIINFPEDSSLTTASLQIGYSYSTSDKTTLQTDVHGVFAIATWESGHTQQIYNIFNSSCWSSTYFTSGAQSFLFKRSEEYPDAAVFDRIVKIELVALKENLAIGDLPYGTAIGTYFPANTRLIINGNYWE